MPGSWPRSSIKERIFLDKLLSRIILFLKAIYMLFRSEKMNPHAPVI